MYEHARERLREAGYIHYEISNWARPGHECAHNLTYWRNLPYIGLGAGAHSWYAGRRFVEAKSLREYTERDERKHHITAQGGRRRASSGGCYRGRGHLARAGDGGDRYTRMRLTAGVDLADFERRYGQSLESVFAERLREAREAGLVETVEGRLRLTEQGTLLGNEVFAALLPDAT